MPITANDIKLFGAENLTDTKDGGGRIGSTVIVDGVENNVFPDISPSDRSNGALKLRKLYPKMVNTDRDALMSAKMRVATMPTDPGVDVALFSIGDKSLPYHLSIRGLEPNYGTNVISAALQLEAKSTTTFPLAYASHGNWWNTVGFAADEIEMTILDGTLLKVGDLLFWGANPLTDIPGATGVIRVTEIINVGAQENPVQHIRYVEEFPVAPSLKSNNSYSISQYPSRRVPTVAGVGLHVARCVGLSTLTAGASATDTSIAVNRVRARVVPMAAGGPYPQSATGISPNGYLKYLNGLVPIFRVGDEVYLEDAVTPSINEVRVVQHVGFNGTLEFTVPLANSYVTGSKVCAFLPVGDLQAMVGPSFSQQTWTKQFSDTLIGNTISAQYNRNLGDLNAVNAGAITERWAVVMTSSSAFKLIGESVGQIANGTTGTDFAPLNPITNSPYFTLPAAGWGSGWATGNVLRFNTTGADAPVWAAQCVSPSSPSGLVETTLETRGAVNA